MKNLGRNTLTLFITLVATSFTSPIVEDKTTEFTVNGLNVIPRSPVKKILARVFLLKMALHIVSRRVSIALITEITA